MPTTTDRLSQLRASAVDFTGVEFVQVVDKCDQRVLRIYFLTDTLELRPPFEDVGDVSVIPEPLTPDLIRIYSPRGEAPDVLLDPDPANMLWAEDTAACRRYLEVVVREPGTFTDYRLNIDDSRIDSVFNDVAFSFKVGCDDDLDCAEPTPECIPPDLVDFPVDYLARDFTSFRNALLDFAAQRYPDWQLPKEADIGVMFLEIMSAVGDELSYVQDRINREVYLETASERRSLRKKARLVDHEIHDGRMASTTLELTVTPGTTTIPGGSIVWALVEGVDPIAFEIGKPLNERDSSDNYLVDELWNRGNFTPYCFDDEDTCLQPGATSVYVRNDPAGPDNPGGILFDAISAEEWGDGRLLLLRDIPDDATEVERLHLVRVTSVELLQDQLFSIDLARIEWDESDALPFFIPMEELELSGNLVPATAGETRSATFRLGPLQSGDGDAVLQAVEREGPLYSDADPSLLERRDPCADESIDPSSRSPIYLLSLPGSEENGLAFADSADDLRATVPEIVVYPDGEEDDPWTFVRSLLGCPEDAEAYTLEDGTWRRIAGYWRDGVEYVHRDYASGDGYTLRFGDGEFGRLPPGDSLFHIIYRLGSGMRANLSAGAVSAVSIPNQDPPHVGPLDGLVESLGNPFPITNGADPETLEQIRMLTPAAYQAETLFAVRPEDYGAQAEKLDLVQRAQGSLRWTGSWLSVTTSIDPRDAFELSPAHRQSVENLLDCRRQAGRHVIVADPKYINLDLRITVCVSPDAFPAHVETMILEALFGRTGARSITGFFDPDNFTFGSPLRRGALEASIAAVDGVEAIMGIDIRVHGVTDFEPLDSLNFEVGVDELIRLENVRSRPERGSLQLTLAGGA